MKTEGITPSSEHFPARAISSSISKGALIVISAYIGVQMISDIASLQVVSFFGLALDAGTFIYPISFTLRDAAHRILGKRLVRWIVVAAAAINLFMATYFYAVSLIPIHQAGGGTEAWGAVLTPVWRITLASIAAELIAELVDTEMYALFMKRFGSKHKWGRVLSSNAVSIPLDSVLFAFGAFFGLIPTEAVYQIFIGNVLIKFVVTLFSVPLIYVGKSETDEV